VNKGGAEALLSAVGGILDRLQPSRFIDLYGGVGFFGSYAASRGIRDILVVESDAAAAEAAKFNLKKFGITDPQVIAGDAGLALKELKNTEAPDTLLLVDPPRGGLTLRAAMCLTGSALENFVYISCNPATWARDAVRLQKGGFKLAEVQLVNMFPRTEHFELVSLFRR
jgi:23S rRNA (uracil1939-C5)-methyltransferase